MQLRQPIDYDVETIVMNRLVGHAPILHITDAGPTPNPGPRFPATQRTRIRLVAQGKKYASVAEVSFLVDKGIISSLRAGDILHIARAGCGRIGMSSIRGDRLHFAVGAITSVPLGRDFSACVPMDLVYEAEGIFRKRDRDFEFMQIPVEIRAAGVVHVLFRGGRTIGDLDVWVIHTGLRGGLWYQGGGECIAVSRKGACPNVDANSSALFLDTDNLEMVYW
jgi:hypothetical protein